MSRTSLVTVLYDSNDVLEGFFKSLTKQTYLNYHVYFIDNTPSVKTDHLLEELSIKYPIQAYSHIKNSSNVGVAKGNNQGINLALNDGADYVLLLNNDIEFDDEQLLTALINKMTYQNIIVPKIVYYDNPRLIWMAGGKIDKWQGVSLHVGGNKPDSEKYNVFRYFTYAPTCFMLLKREVFENVGLMDEKYFVYYDDTDFIYRAVQYGYKIAYIPDLVVKHKVSISTGGKLSLFSIYYVTRNRIYFIKKNFKGITRIIALFLTFFSRYVRYFTFNKEQKKTLLKAIKDSKKI